VWHFRHRVSGEYSDDDDRFSGTAKSSPVHVVFILRIMPKMIRPPPTTDAAAVPSQEISGNDNLSASAVIVVGSHDAIVNASSADVDVHHAQFGIVSEAPHVIEPNVEVVGGEAAVQSLVPVSPSKNRERFMINCQPLRVCCDLNKVGLSAAGVRFSFQAVVFVVYPASEKPDRRHVMLVDAFGSTGLTVWGAHVPLFTAATVGTVAKFTKLGMVVHNGKKALSMGKDTTVVFVPSSVSTDESKWWHALMMQPPLRIIDVHGCDDNVVVNVAGIVGMLSTETKKVRSDNKDLMNLRLTDRTGFIDIRSWNHCEGEFSKFLEKPLLFQRLRVTSFAGTKILELLEGNATNILPEFENKADLVSYWNE